MFLAYIRLIFRGSFVEITTAILLVYKILKKPLDVPGYWYMYWSCCFHYRFVGGHDIVGITLHLCLVSTARNTDGA
jgi:hypothetical protein